MQPRRSRTQQPDEAGARLPRTRLWLEEPQSPAASVTASGPRELPAPSARPLPAIGREADAVHGALEVELVEHRPADQADQQRVPPCRDGEWHVLSPHPRPRQPSPGQPGTHTPSPQSPLGPQARKRPGQRTQWLGSQAGPGVGLMPHHRPPELLSPRPRAVTFIDHDGQAAVWGQPYTLDVVPSSQGQSVRFVAIRQKPQSCSWSRLLEEGAASDPPPPAPSCPWLAPGPELTARPQLPAGEEEIRPGSWRTLGKAYSSP